MPGSRSTVRCDVELILHLYKIFHENLTTFGSVLDGVFAFCLVDLDERKIVVGRDALGVRPLYKIWSGGFLAIASEEQGLLPFLEGNPHRKVEQFPPGTIEEYTVHSSGKVVLQSISQFVPCAGGINLNNNQCNAYTLATFFSLGLKYILTMR